MSATAVTDSQSWSRLIELAQSVGSSHIRDLFADHVNRPSDLTFDCVGIRLDLSRQRITSEVVAELLNLAVDRDLERARDAMFSGQHINSTEDRAVLHTALRLPAGTSLIVDGHDVVPDIHDVLRRMAELAQAVREGTWLGATGQRIRHVVNIGIGGSDLGPVMAFEALRHFATDEISFHFVSNVDATDIAETLKNIDPLETLFIVASKTFGTQETMMNAHAARDALMKVLPDPIESAVAKHFVAVSTSEQRVREFGIDVNNMFGFWDWVGGRYSMDSAIGLSTMIAIGSSAFGEMLAGFRAMDEHFLTAPLAENLPVLMGLVGVWNRSLLGIETVAVLPYDQYLKRFPAYLQQLVMESNGKSVTRDGHPVIVETGAVYWGEPGTNGQHSFYQLIHQGTSFIAADVIVVAQSHNHIGNHQDVLVSNALAQANVLAFGRTLDQLVDAHVPSELQPHKVMPGNRPTSVIAVDRIDAFTLGALVALYEHMVFVQGVVWGINSFDQWCVELGKEMASSIAPYLTNTADISHFDTATQAAIEWYRQRRAT